jgi:hypothetical protein
MSKAIDLSQDLKINVTQAQTCFPFPQAQQVIRGVTENKRADAKLCSLL